MSRVGKTPIKVASGVKIDIKGQLLKVEGPKGKLSFDLPKGITVKVEGAEIKVTRNEGVAAAGALQGVVRTQIHNMVTGVSTGFTRELDIVGVGYRAAMKGNVLSMTVGYSHPVDFKLPEGIQGKVDANTHVVLTGADKQLLGLTADKIRGVKPPEPYQGKGIRYTNEHIIRKAGKAAAGAK
ncbi:MAG: 50S ribosomal protein L6 [Bdellovibrionales bacterium]|nr:50S ribosomal protein L6 [Bdellovibrionales bacterium]